MEAVQVMQEDNTASILTNLSESKVYNIGMGEHSFPQCASRLQKAVSKYRPSKFVVLEVLELLFTDRELEDIFSDTVKYRTRSKLSLLIRKNDALMWIGKNWGTFIRASLAKPSEITPVINPALLSKVLAHIHNIASRAGAKLIIAYHPPVSLNLDGTLNINAPREIVNQFAELCAQNGIYFLDMSERFLTEYAENYTLPYGFINTSVGNGHMNKYGHRMFAEEINRLIQKIEREEI